MMWEQEEIQRKLRADDVTSAEKANTEQLQVKRAEQELKAAEQLIQWAEL